MRIWKSKRVLAVTAFAVSAAVAVGLSGCSSDGGSDAKGPVTLTMWVNSSDQAAQKNLYAAWEKESGNKIKFISIASAGFEDATMTRWATGSRPDLMEWHPERAFLAGLNPTDNLQPLDGMAYIKKSDGLYKDNGTWEGKTYAAILNGPSLYGMYFNKKVLEEAGVQAPSTYDELKKVCAAVKEKVPGVTPIFQAGGTLWPLTVLPFNLWGGHYDEGNKIAYNQAKFTDKNGAFLTAIQKFKDLQDAGCYNSDINTATEEQSFQAVYTGQAAILFQTSSEISVLQAAAGGDDAKMSAAVGWGSVGDTKSWANYQPVPTGTFLAPKSGNAAQEKAAKDFIEFATGKYYQTYVNESKQAPTITGVKQPTDIGKLQQEINDFYAKSPKEPLFNANIAGFAEFVQLMPQLAAGQLTPEQLAQKEQAVVEQASRAANVKGWN